MPAASLRALLEHSIDYAGLFPPAALELEPALTNQAQYVRSDDLWMLNAFVLPVAQFRAATRLLPLFDPQHPLCVSALGPKTNGADAFLGALAETANAIRLLSNHSVDVVSISQLEMSLPVEAGANVHVSLELLEEAQKIIGSLPAFWEAPANDAERTIALLAEHNSNMDSPTFGFKLRTGGVTADAFPTSAEIATVLATSAMHRIAIKFTAGLHHPVRQFRTEVQTRMHGFLNVLGAAMLAAEHKWDVKQTAAMLDDENPKSFSFDDDSLAWREWKIDLKRLIDHRKFVTSFGSCSFDEPRDDLRTLNLL